MHSDLPRLHVVGDSISIRYGPDLERMLDGVARYSRKPQIGDDPESANARDSASTLAYLIGLSAAVRTDIDYLMINCGLHDIKRNLDDGHALTPLDQYVDNLRTIAWYAREGTHTLVWVRTTPVVDAIHNTCPDVPFRRFASDVATYNAAADAVMREAGVYVIDLFGFTRSLGADLYCDHVHFTPEVARLQAAYVAGNLSQIIT
jgi:lysophospholipase L1-like esterase